MSRYVDFDDVLDALDFLVDDCADKDELYHRLFDAIDVMLLADVKEVQHGEWLDTNDEDKKRCSECDVVFKIYAYPNSSNDYCPNCGAKMDKE